MWGAEPESIDPALAIGTRRSWTLLYATCAKLFNTVPDPETGKAAASSRRSRGAYTRLEDGRTYTFELKRTFRFHTGEPVDRSELRGRLQPHRASEDELRSPRRRGFFDEIVGTDAAMRGEAATISGVQVLGRYRLRIRLTRRAGDFVARLTMPFFCPILPGTPIDPRGHGLPAGIGALLHRGARPEAAHGPGAESLLRRQSHRQPGPHHLDDRARRRRANPGHRAGRERLHAGVQLPGRGRARPRRQVRPQPARGSVAASPGALTSFMFAFNTRSPAFKGAGTAPLRKAINYALDRPALADKPRLPGGNTERSPAAARRSARAGGSIRSTGPCSRTARKWLARAKQRPKTLTLYTANFAYSIANAQVFAANLKQLDIDVHIDELLVPGAPREARSRGGSRGTSPGSRGARGMPTRPASSSRC